MIGGQIWLHVLSEEETTNTRRLSEAFFLGDNQSVHGKPCFRHLSQLPNCLSTAHGLSAPPRKRGPDSYN
jgi:hypothetical protein